MPFVFQKLPSSVVPTVVSFVQDNCTLWSLGLTNKSNFVLTSLRRQQFYQRFCFKEAKSILKRLRQRYGKDPLKNACVAALSSSRPDRLTDVDKILELLDVNDKTNRHSPFENVLLWARCSGFYDTDRAVPL